MQFISCRGHDNCTEDGTHCKGCGRSHEAIAETRRMIGELAEFAVKMEYENVEEFARYVADKTVKKVKKIRKQNN